MARSKQQIKTVIFDADGVLTDGKFLYTADGKYAKIYGPDDSDGLSILKKNAEIVFITGDKRGFAITKKRIEDMKFSVHLVSTFERLDWIKEHYDLNSTVYMGDGIYDALVFPHVAYSVAPANAFYLAKDKADFVTKSRGGEGAVAEACLHIMEKFFEPFDLEKLDLSGGSGAWAKNEKKHDRKN